MRNLPLIAFALLVLVFAIGLSMPEAERKAPAQSGLVGAPLPPITLAPLDSDQQLSNDAFTGQITVLNIFASWCAPCIAELPEFAALKKQFPSIRLIGVGWHDGAKNIKQWVNKHNAPYDQVLMDTEKQIGVQLGIRGVPETFIIDAQGVVRYHLPGALHATLVERELAPLIKELVDE